MKKVIKENHSLTERIYLWEIIRGLSITIRYFFKNLLASLKPGHDTIKTTTQYPEVRREIEPVWRGLHILKKTENGLEKCVACKLCELVCPSHCITIEPAESGELKGVKYLEEKHAAKYEINLLRCVFCGYCEEVCPKDAIELNTEYELARFTRGESQYSKEMLYEAFERAKARGTVKKNIIVETAPKA